MALPITLFGFVALLFLLPFSGEVSRPLRAAAYPAPLAIAVQNLDDGGPGSLRQAIDDVASGGTITFDVTGTITLTTGQLFVDKDLTIDGPGAALLAISGNNAQRVLQVASGAAVTIEGVTIRNGFDTGDGAGINVEQSTLTLINTVVAYNVTVHGGGGILGNDSTITLSGSTFHDNSAESSGGAIKTILGTLSSINTTFSGNVTLMEGGALALFSTDAAIVHNTFSGNTPDSIATINEPVVIKNSIFAGAPGAEQCFGDPAPTGAGVNLTTGSCTAGDVAVTPAGLKLDPVLADNGGPTPTHKLLAGSAAIDAATDCTTIPSLEFYSLPGVPVIADQRGVARPQGLACDAGAFELQLDTAGLVQSLRSFAAAAGMGKGDNNLDNVLKHLTKPAGNTLIPACNNLDAFIKKAGKLAPPQGPAIVTAAQSVKLAIGCP